MELIKLEDLLVLESLTLNEVSIENGSGVFLIEGGQARQKKSIKVHYHRPENFTAQSPILLVLPGAGRNGDSYRDAWVKASEFYNILVLSPEYAEKDYPFKDYHLGGIISSWNIQDQISFDEHSNKAYLKEDSLNISYHTDSTSWIFNDFDRIFDLAVQATASQQQKYDVFGHSAGGQILHRFVLFHPHSKANRILASNSGFYTLADEAIDFPFGLAQTHHTTNQLPFSFKKQLTLFIGALDNAQETGGTLLRSPTVDKQGLHRLERAHFFYKHSKEKATDLQADFNWQIEIIQGVGHDHHKMSQAASNYLYNK